MVRHTVEDMGRGYPVALQLQFHVLTHDGLAFKVAAVVGCILERKHEHG